MNFDDVLNCPFPTFPRKYKGKKRKVIKQKPTDEQLAFLLALGWTQVEIAAFTGYHPMTVRNWRYHINARPSYGRRYGVVRPIFPLPNEVMNVQKANRATMDRSGWKANPTMSQSR